MDIYEQIDRLHQAISLVKPFEGHMLEELKEYYRIGLTWSSNAIEGNTMTISETKVILEDGLTVGGRPLRDFYETVGHGEAYDFMFSMIKKKTIDQKDIKTIHYLFYRKIDETQAGIWRTERILVSGSQYPFPKPEDIQEQMQALENWINQERNRYHPVRFAALLHLKFVSIHPFIDGNGRTSRLLMNLALIQKGYQLAIIPPILRTEYNDTIRQYQNKGKENPFCELIAERVFETQKEIMNLLHIPYPSLT